MQLRSRIEKLCESHGMTLKRLASLIPIAEQTLHRNMNRNSMETKYLERISQIFNISPTYFFENSENIVIEDNKSQYKPIDINEKYQSCLEELRELNKIIRDLNKKIRELEKEVGDKNIPSAEIKQKTTNG